MKALAIVGHSGAGKTTLLETLIPRLRAQGLRVLALKHTSHAHAVHSADTDSERLARVGASLSGFASPEGLALFHGQVRDDAALMRELEWLASRADLLLVEGWKHGPLPKVEVWRPSLEPPLAAARDDVVGLVSEQAPRGLRCPWIPRASEDEILRRVLDWATELRPSGLNAKVSGFPEMMAAPAGSHRSVQVQRRSAADAPPVHAEDTVAVEEPLEIRILGETLAVTMRTPGDDAALCAGFLYSEGIVRRREELGSIFHCGRLGDEGFGNTIEVTPAPGVLLDVDKTSRTRRGTLTTSACGVCGRQSVDDLVALCGKRPPSPPIPERLIGEAMRALGDSQPLFARTGGVHAALVLSRSGERLCAFEDVGRHNAVDKAVGRLLLDGKLGGEAAVLAVSGRTSFEILQKAAMAAIPLVAGVSAPSSLAVSVAQRMGLTLAGFVRGSRYNLYSHPEQVDFS